MSGLSIQYYNGTDYTQLGLDVADYTVATGKTAENFICIKDGSDNLHILAFTNTNVFTSVIKYIKVSSVGAVTVCSFGGYYSNSISGLSLSRDGSTLFFSGAIGTSGSTLSGLFSITLGLTGPISYTTILNGLSSLKFALYQDRYIWVASGSTVKIYDYTTKAELASFSQAGTVTPVAICADYDNTKAVSYCVFRNTTYNTEMVIRLTYNNTTTLLNVGLIPYENYGGIKQILLDKWGDLVLLTNSGTTSTLLKYTTAGVQIGTALDLGVAFYNLNTDKDGNYYYSNALGTYKITANTAQGQAFTGVGTKIRGSGMTTYNNNITGYNPAVFGTQE